MNGSAALLDGPTPHGQAPALLKREEIVGYVLLGLLALVTLFVVITVCVGIFRYPQPHFYPTAQKTAKQKPDEVSPEQHELIAQTATEG